MDHQHKIFRALPNRPTPKPWTSRRKKALLIRLDCIWIAASDAIFSSILMVIFVPHVFPPSSRERGGGGKPQNNTIKSEGTPLFGANFSRVKGEMTLRYQNLRWECGQPGPWSLERNPTDSTDRLWRKVRGRRGKTWPQSCFSFKPPSPSPVMSFWFRRDTCRVEVALTVFNVETVIARAQVVNFNLTERGTALNGWIL